MENVKQSMKNYSIGETVEIDKLAEKKSFQIEEFIFIDPINDATKEEKTKKADKKNDLVNSEYLRKVASPDPALSHWTAKMQQPVRLNRLISLVKPW